MEKNASRPFRIDLGPRKKFCKRLVIALIAGIPVISNAADDTIESLKKQIEELDQKVRTLQRKLELDSETAETRAKETPRLTVGANGVTFSSADTNFVMRFHGYAQADARFFLDDHIPINDTFLMRRVRLIWDGAVFKHYEYRVQLDFGSAVNSTPVNDSYLQDAYLNVNYWKAFQIQVGKFKVPLGLERSQSGANLLFIERGLPTDLTPNRDVGLQLHGELFGGALNYQAGIFNGVQDGASSDLDGLDDHKEAAARIFTHPFKNTQIKPLQGLGLGVGGTWGNSSGSLPVYKTVGQEIFYSYAVGTGTNVTADGDHWRLVPQGYYYWGPFGMFGEYAISDQKVRRDATGTPTQFTRADNRAWGVAGSWFLTGEQNSFKPVKITHPLDLGEGTFGALELAARYGQLTLDNDLFVLDAPGGVPLFASPNSANQATYWGVGLNWFLNQNIKVSLTYDQTQFRGGSTKPGQVTAQDEKVIMTQAQFAF